jgi:hypothetical protein
VARNAENSQALRKARSEVFQTSPNVRSRETVASFSRKTFQHYRPYVSFMLRIANAHEPRHENMPQRHIPCLGSYAFYATMSFQRLSTKFALLCDWYGLDSLRTFQPEQMV